jgi:large subunit ribosomal protein L4
MLDIPVLNTDGKEVGKVSIDAAHLGGKVRPRLLKQAIVMYQAALRVGTAATKSRSDVEGSTRKLYRQKGTGNARMGAIRTPVRRGGGCTFAKRKRDFSKRMPKRMRRLACRNALLARILSGDVVVMDNLQISKPQTRALASVLNGVGADRGCLLALDQRDDAVYRSSRTLPRTEVLPVADLNAYALLRRRKVVFTKAAFEALNQKLSADAKS